MKIQFEYFWQLKDKRTFIEDAGIHWKLKKFIVLYYYLLVERQIKIDTSLIKKISNKFKSFCESYSDPLVKKKAYDFFFKPVDFRSYESNYEKFNEGNENNEWQDDLIRKFYFFKLYPLGAQSSMKKFIKPLLEQDLSFKAIIEKTRNEYNNLSKKKFNKELVDFHAEIRNYRQALSKLGILPNEEDGYEINDISKSLLYADHYSLRAIWEEQKIKLRFTNPDYDEIHSKYYKKEFTEINDFDDLFVSPYIEIINILDILKRSKQDPIIKFSEYKNIICREKNFDTSNVVRKIIKFRKKTKEEQDSISDQFDARPKQRDFSIEKKGEKKDEKEDFKKIQQNLIYGLSRYKFSKDNNFNNVFSLKNQKDFRESYIEILDKRIFEKLAIFTSNIKTYLLKYNNFFKLFSFYTKIKLIDKIINDDRIENTYRDKIKFLRKKLKKLEKFSNEQLYLTPYLWKNYFQKHDKQLAVCSFALVHAIDNFYQKDFSYINSIEIPDYLKKLGITKNTELKKIIISFIEGKKIIQSLNLDNNKEDIFDVQSSNLGYSLLRSIVKLQANDGLFTNEAITTASRKIRSNIIQKEAEKLRLKNKLVMGEKRPHYEIEFCDAGCGTKFGIDKKTNKRNFQVHHLIPIDLFGPDHILNYAFLCINCHRKINPDGSQNRADQKKIIDNLKLNGIIKKDYYFKLIDKNLLKSIHIDFLYLEKFIHLPIKLELIKKLKINKKFADDFEKKSIEFGVSKTGIKEERWSRPCWAVFKERYQGKIMEEFRDDYKFDFCDTGCGNKLEKGKFDCHHIIPKKQDPGFGPESPFNYVYICKSCHGDFTHRKEKRKMRIEGLKKNKLVTFNTVFQMLTMDGIKKNQIKYLFDEKYLSEKEFKYLIDLLEKKIKSN